jgi:DNA-binding NarL/FixJ family response regulator
LDVESQSGIMIRERRVDVVNNWQRNHEPRRIFELDSSYRSQVRLVSRLNPLQLEVLELLVRGMTNKEISRELQMGFGTVKVHVVAILQGLNVTNRASARKVGSQFLQANMDSGQTNSAA